MNLADIRQKAKVLGISKTVGVKKADLIREVQKKEGNFPCFGTALFFCDQWSCCFRDECIQKTMDN